MTKQLKNLDDALINQVEVHPRSRIFKFGNCHKVTVIASVKIPAQIGEKTVLYKKTLPRPAVSILKSLNFNKMVAMDLHQLDDNLWYLHFIDEFSRFSNSLVIKSKQSNIKTLKILKY